MIIQQSLRLELTRHLPLHKGGINGASSIMEAFNTDNTVHQTNITSTKTIHIQNWRNYYETGKTCWRKIQRKTSRLHSRKPCANGARWLHKIRGERNFFVLYAT